MKTIVKTLVIAVFAAFISKASAQTPQNLGKFIDKQNQESERRYQNQTALIAGLNNDKFNYKYDFVVTMTDGSKKEVKSKIYSDPAVLKSYLIFEDKSYAKTDTNRNKKIYPSQTISIERTLESLDPGEGTTKGIAKDSCWMFKALSGPINAYSFLSLQGEDPTFNPATLVGIQSGNGPIVQFSIENLVSMLQQDSAALDYINKKDYFNAIKKYNGDNVKE